MDIGIVNEAFKLSYAGASLEEDALRGGLSDATEARRTASFNYGKAVELLVQEGQKAHGSTARVLLEMAHFLQERMKKTGGGEPNVRVPRVRDTTKG